MNAIVLLAAAALAVAPAGPHEWSVEMLDGTPAATATLFTGVVMAPGNSVSSGYLIPHSADLIGPLDIAAEPLTAPNELEDSLSFQFDVDGAPGPTARLTDLLRDGSVVRVTDALPAGTTRLGVTVRMSPAPITQAKLQTVRFRFVLTVSDETIVIPVTPPAALAATGSDPPSAALAVIAGAALGVGMAAIGLRRRARRTPRAAGPPPAAPRPGPASQAAAILARWSPPSTAVIGRRRSPS